MPRADQVQRISSPASQLRGILEDKKKSVPILSFKLYKNLRSWIRSVSTFEKFIYTLIKARLLVDLHAFNMPFE